MPVVIWGSANGEAEHDIVKAIGNEFASVKKRLLTFPSATSVGQPIGDLTGFELCLPL